MQKPPHASPRESTEAMVRNIGRELAEIEQALITAGAIAWRSPG
jgi:hypothetical protein